VPTIVTTNFAPGMRRDYAFAGGQPGLMEDIQNFDIDRHGRLVRRGGSSNYTASAFTNPVGHLRLVDTVPVTVGSGNSLQLLIATSLNNGTNVKGSIPTDPSGTFSQTLSNHSLRAVATDFKPSTYQNLFAPTQAFEGRIFTGLCPDNDGGISWGDQNYWGAGQLFTAGSAAPVNIALEVNTDGTGTDLDASWYNVGYTYYNSEFGIETKLITDTVEATSHTICLTMRHTIDEGFNQYRFYRSSSGQASAVLAAAQGVQFIAAATKTDGTATDYVDFDAGTYGFDGASVDTAYTLGALNDTYDHDKLTGIVHFMAAEDGVLWVAQQPRTIRFSKRTSDTFYPDWFPIENDLSIGNADTKITGIVRHPLGQGILVFTNQEVLRISGTSVEDIQVQTVLAMGCPYPRTIIAVDQDIYFLNNRHKVVRYSGGGVEILSDAIDEEFSNLRPHQEWMPVAVVDHEKYYIAYCQGGAHSTSSTNGITYTTNTTSLLFGGGADGDANDPTDGSAWDLSGVAVGDWAFSTKKPTTMHGIVTRVDDGTDTLTVEGRTLPTSPDTLEILRNDTLGVYDLEYRNWVTYKGLGIYSMVWVAATETIIAGRYADGHAIKLNTSDATDAGSVAITSTVSSPWRSPQPGGKYVKLDSLQIMMVGGAETALTITTYLDGDTTGTVATTRTPGPSNVHEIAFDDQVGFQYRYKISGAASGTIIRIVEHWEAV
jgi:hypothetical protein